VQIRLHESVCKDIVMQLNLGHQAAVVVGGASGIGLAIAKEFAHEGCRVGIVDRSDETERVAGEIAGGGDRR
jgi:2-hydroxycyclohexanecarboxyl-CoA dehydrogenase